MATAAELLGQQGTPASISLRTLAAELGVAPNAVYTYFPDLAAVWHAVADDALGELRPTELLDRPCPRCALVELATRGRELFARPGVVPLLRAGPVLGPHSFALSETVMALASGGSVTPRDAHDLLMGWFFGSAMLVAAGWESETDAIRASGEGEEEFPLVFGRDVAHPEAQLDALLRGIGLECRSGCPREAEGRAAGS